MKRTTRTALAILSFVAAAFVFAPAAGARVRVQHDPQIDFQQYETYTWAEEAEPESITLQWFRTAIDRQLSEQGLVQVEGQADLVLRSTASLEVDTIQQVYRTTPVRHRRWRSVGWNTWTVDAWEITTGTYQLQVVDAEAGEIVLESTASGAPRSNVEKTQRKMAKAAIRMLQPLNSD